MGGMGFPGQRRTRSVSAMKGAASRLSRYRDHGTTYTRATVPINAAGASMARRRSEAEARRPIAAGAAVLAVDPQPAGPRSATANRRLHGSAGAAKIGRAHV